MSSACCPFARVSNVELAQMFLQHGNPEVVDCCSKGEWQGILYADIVDIWINCRLSVGSVG